MQKNTIDAIEAKSLLILEETKKSLASTQEDLKTNLTDHSVQLKDLQEKIKQTLDILDPEIEEDLGKTENTDTASTATKIVRKATTQIERIAANQQKMSMSYYNSANEQAQQGFRLAWLLSIMGAALLAVTIIAAILMTSLHLYGYATLLGAIGGIGTTIATFMGGLSSLQARTAKQFARALMLLDRSYRPTIAHAMCVGYSDDDRKQAAYDKIIDGLLKNDDPVKDLT